MTSHTKIYTLKHSGQITSTLAWKRIVNRNINKYYHNAWVAQTEQGEVWDNDVGTRDSLNQNQRGRGDLDSRMTRAENIMSLKLKSTMKAQRCIASAGNS